MILAACLLLFLGACVAAANGETSLAIGFVAFLLVVLYFGTT